MNKTPNNLRLYRKQAGLFQREVAQALRLDCTDRISHWEKGTAVPSLINLFRLASIYKVSPQDLYSELWQMTVNQFGQNRMPAQTLSNTHDSDTTGLSFPKPASLPEVSCISDSQLDQR